MEHGAKIIFTRPGGHYRDALRSYILEVDGVSRGWIKPAQVVAIDVEPGRHTVRARISWTGSPRQEVSLRPDGEVRLRVEPAGTPAQGLWQVVGRTRWLRITAEPVGGEDPVDGSSGDASGQRLQRPAGRLPDSASSA